MRGPAIIVVLVLMSTLIGRAASAAWTCDRRENVPVCTAQGDQVNLAVSADGRGGVFIVWEDFRSGDSDIYAQHLDVDGNTTWALNGAAVCTAFGEQAHPSIVSDGAAGAIFRGATREVAPTTSMLSDSTRPDHRSGPRMVCSSVEPHSARSTRS